MATRHLLSLGHRKIAFITGPSYLEGSDSRLKGCRKAFENSVPDDVSVVGYDDHFVSGILSVPLTTVHQPIYDMGREAARILIHAAENKDAEPVISHFDLKLIVRSSTRKI